MGMKYTIKKSRSINKIMENASTEILKCPLCQNTKLDYLFQSRDYISLEPFGVYGCACCDLAITDTKLTNNNISNYYSKGYYGQRKFLVEDIINNTRIRTLLKFKDLLPPFSLLDVGCGNGTFLMSMRDHGWRSFGTEIAPSEHLRENVKEFIYKGDFKDGNFKENSFDIVTMWHSLEHVKDPLGYFMEARRVLKPNGILLVEIPNFRSWQSKIFKKNWFHLDVPRHLLHFSPKSIEILFNKAGFTNIVVKNSSLIYSFFGCLQSILNSVSNRKNLFFDFLNNKISLYGIYRDHKKDFFVNIILFIPALILSVLLFFVELITGRSGIILIFANKQI